MKNHAVLLAGLVTVGLSGARLIAQAPEEPKTSAEPTTPTQPKVAEVPGTPTEPVANDVDGPDEAGKEFIAYLARQDFDSLKNVVAQDSFRQLGEGGVDALLHDLRLVPDRWTATNGENGDILVTPIFDAKPVICKKEGAFWRVDAIATGARWRQLDAIAGASRIVREYSVLPQLGEDSRATCLTNLQALAIAMRQYQEDYKDAYPPAARWNDALAPYVRNEKVFHCPAVGKNSYGYALNAKLTVRPPAATALAVLYENAKPERNANNDGHDLVFRHEERTQALFSDGTARTLSKPRKPLFQLPVVKK